MMWRITRSAVGGPMHVPGDKSIGHRALMLAALADGESRIANLPNGEDVQSTARCLAACGVSISSEDGRTWVDPPRTLSAPVAILDAGNSGTTMRLLAGILSGQPFSATIAGDSSLSRRPMERVAEPLRLMGATVDTCHGLPPLTVRGGNLRSIAYRLPIASAQVKSAILFAALFATGITRVAEPAPSRDHTERILAATGVHLQSLDGAIALEGGTKPRAFSMAIPGDPSTAAFFLAAAVLGEQVLTVRRVGVNPTRAGFLSALERMGVDVELTEQFEEMGEPVADVTVRGAAGQPIEIGPQDVPGVVDEIPLIALLATQVSGISTIRGAAELRVKESDRIARTVQILRALGANVQELPDGMVIEGPARLHGTQIQSDGDHRMAMMAAVAGTVASGETVVEGAEAAAVSYPAFATALSAAGGRIDVV